MITYKDYVKNPKRVEGCIANLYVLDEAILYCMEYIPNGRKGTHKRGRPTFMDDDADKEQPLDKGNVIHLETLKYEQVDDEPYCLASQALQVFYCQDPTRTDLSVVIYAPKRLDKDIDAYEEPLAFETENHFTSSIMGLINENVDEDEEITEGSWMMISPSQSMPNPSEPLPIPAGGSHEHSTTSGGGSFITLYLLLRAIKTLEECVLPEAAKRKLMKSANNLWRNEKKTLRKKYDERNTDEVRKMNCPKKTRPKNWVRFFDLSSTEEVKASRERNKINRSKMVTPHMTGRKGVFRVADEMMEVNPTTTRSYSFLVGHTRSDGTFPTALVAEKVLVQNVIVDINTVPKSSYSGDSDPSTNLSFTVNTSRALINTGAGYLSFRRCFFFNNQHWIGLVLAHPHMSTGSRILPGILLRFLPIKLNLPMIVPPIASVSKNQSKYSRTLADIQGGYLKTLSGDVYNKLRLLTSRDYNHFYIELKDIKKKVGVLVDRRLAHVDVGKASDILRSLYFKDPDIKAVSTCSDLLTELAKMIQLARYEYFIISLAQAYMGYIFYLPAFVDFRGRIYRAGVLPFHKRDLSRSLLRFSSIRNNKDIDISTIDSKEYSGVVAAFKYKKFTSLDEAFEWYKLNSPIMNSSDISLIELAQDASEPFQFLAKVISIERVDKGLTSKEIDCELLSIPVTQEASASAYQLMSLMLLNIEMANSYVPTIGLARVKASVLVIAVKEIIAKNPQSKYLDVDHDLLAQVFGKAENDAKLDSLRDMVTSLRSFERAATPTANVDRSRVLLVVRFLTFVYAHKGLKMIPIFGSVISYFCGCV
ncbi:hypothetical protein GIB67_017942 [Kingdonia uniflora]|uniref:Uncharacterized protein n=1 Tax=Kingdonia uniflora TaxID=39325 RepID=A0A7J7MIE6_9MAGN|nr:hypothetical protein GIB67_017942 [Kingdonia uniflora]